MQVISIPTIPMVLTAFQVIKRCKEARIESVYDAMEMEDKDRNQLL